MLAIRLARMGATHQPCYRVVVSESLRTPRARNKEVIGYYDPRQEPPRIQIDRTRAEFWMKRGARPSLTVRQLLEKAVPETPAAPES